MKRNLQSCSGAWSILTLMVFFLLVPTESSALRIELAFDRLPSQQGWSYSGTVPESDVFSVSGGILRMDRRGHGDTMARYYQSGVINPTQPFSLRTSLRIIDSENLSGNDNHNVFEIFIHGQNFWTNLFWSAAPESGKSWVGISERWYSGGAVARSINSLVDDTGSHEYLLEVTPGGRFKASIDGVTWARGLTPDLPFIGFNDILFQEGSRESEPFMEMRQFVFNQPIPEPATIVLFVSGLSAIIVRGCRRRGIRKNQDSPRGQRWMHQTIVSTKNFT